MRPREEKAYFALACFWKPDAQFGSCRGVKRTRVGYCGGTDKAPNYPLIGDHTETVEVVYDVNILSYEDLLKLFWKFHNPCQCRKRQYKSAIFYVSDQQRKLAERSKREQENIIGQSVATEILPLDVFYGAENYHQKYFLRTYHKAFYDSLPAEDPVTSTRDARLNGFLSGYGSIEDLENEKDELGLREDQVSYVKGYFTKELQTPAVLPFIRTIFLVMWNYIKKKTGF